VEWGVDKVQTDAIGDKKRMAASVMETAMWESISEYA